jgi:hypothetical protein
LFYRKNVLVGFNLIGAQVGKQRLSPVHDAAEIIFGEINRRFEEFALGNLVASFGQSRAFGERARVGGAASLVAQNAGLGAVWRDGLENADESRFRDAGRHGLRLERLHPGFEAAGGVRFGAQVRVGGEYRHACRYDETKSTAESPFRHTFPLVTQPQQSCGNKAIWCLQKKPDRESQGID